MSIRRTKLKKLFTLLTIGVLANGLRDCVLHICIPIMYAVGWKFSRMLFLQRGEGRWMYKSKKSLNVSMLVKLEFRLSQRPPSNRCLFKGYFVCKVSQPSTPWRHRRGRPAALVSRDLALWGKCGCGCAATEKILLLPLRWYIGLGPWEAACLSWLHCIQLGPQQPPAKLWRSDEEQT